MRTLIKEKSFDQDVKEAFLDFVREDGLSFRDAASMVAQIYNIAFDEVVDMLNSMGIREDSDTKKAVIDEAEKKDDDKNDKEKKDDMDDDDKEDKDSDKKDDEDSDKKDDKKKEATAANTDQVDDDAKEKEKAKQKADDKAKDDKRKADAKKDEDVIVVTEDTPIPGTDIVLEKGDRIVLVVDKD